MKKTIKVFVHQRIAGFCKGDTFVSDYDLSQCDHYKGKDAVRVIHTTELAIDAPENDLDLAEIEALEAQIAKERGESQHKVNLLLERISQLKAIGHEVAA